MPDLFDPFIADESHAALRNAAGRQVMWPGNVYGISRKLNLANKRSVCVPYLRFGNLAGIILATDESDRGVAEPTVDVDNGNVRFVGLPLACCRDLLVPKYISLNWPCGIRAIGRNEFPGPIPVWPTLQEHKTTYWAWGVEVESLSCSGTSNFPIVWTDRHVHYASINKPMQLALSSCVYASATYKMTYRSTNNLATLFVAYRPESGGYPFNDGIYAMLEIRNLSLWDGETNPTSLTLEGVCFDLRGIFTYTVCVNPGSIFLTPTFHGGTPINVRSVLSYPSAYKFGAYGYLTKADMQNKGIVDNGVLHVEALKLNRYGYTYTSFKPISSGVLIPEEISLHGEDTECASQYVTGGTTFTKMPAIYANNYEYSSGYLLRDIYTPQGSFDGRMRCSLGRYGFSREERGFRFC